MSDTDYKTAYAAAVGGRATFRDLYKLERKKCEMLLDVMRDLAKATNGDDLLGWVRESAEMAIAAAETMS